LGRAHAEIHHGLKAAERAAQRIPGGIGKKIEASIRKKQDEIPEIMEKAGQQAGKTAIGTEKGPGKILDWLEHLIK
jgi:hypothetical protein